MAYIDTSALLKWYLPERGSEQFADWVSRQDDIEISRLTCVEVRCALARRQRSGSLDARQVADALRQFETDVHDGLFTLHRVSDDAFLQAEDLLAATAAPLRTLDALHLAVANTVDSHVFATADQTLASAARDRGLRTVLF